METVARSAPNPFSLDWPAPVRLERRIGEALVRARRGRVGALASITVPIDPELDLSAAVFAARRDHERVAQQDLTDAIEKIILGAERQDALDRDAGLGGAHAGRRDLAAARSRSSAGCGRMSRSKS